MSCVRPAGRLSGCGKNFNVAIFSDTINIINVKLCMMIVLIELYPFIILSVTLIVFQGHGSVKQFYLIVLCSYPIKIELCTIVDYVRQIMNIQRKKSNTFPGDN